MSEYSSGAGAGAGEATGQQWVSVTSVLGGVGAAVVSGLASLCCIGPAGIALLGVNGAILAAGIKPYRPYLLAVSFVLIGLAFWAAYGRRRTRGSRCPTRWGRAGRIIVWSAAVIWVASAVVGFLADQYWL